MISARRGPLAARYRDPLPTYPIEGAIEVERPNVVRHLQPVVATEYPDFVLVVVEHRGVRAAPRRNICGRGRHARPEACWDVEDVDAVAG